MERQGLAGKPESTPLEPALESSTGYLLARVGGESRRRWTRVISALGFSGSQHAMLMALAVVGRTSQHQLAEMVGIDPRNAVPVIDQLEERSLIERSREPSDRRRVWLSLTPAGRRSMGQLRRAGEKAERELLSRLTESEQAQLQELLVKLSGPESGEAKEVEGMEKRREREPARRPEDLGRYFLERANAGDVDGLVELYEPDAVLAFPSGRLTRGREAIRQVYAELLAGRPTFSGEQAPAIVNGDLAFTSTRIAGGVTGEVARRQADGSWLWLIDQPNVGG
ncbi:MAG: nuclear transport factor 2 family protein [Candidatus Dormibacteraeota bacterium]|nr:nuclear transport factor 2 family protein [Candidatus Dormibacteraeota bacterium]